jgi:hypothetical protein
MRRIGTLPFVTLLITLFVASPSLGQPHRYRKGVVEKVTVQEKSLTRELGAKDASPTQRGTIFVVVVSGGGAKYTGEFYVEGSNDYPLTLRPGQIIHFRTSQRQIMVCDIHNVMTSVAVNNLTLRDSHGKGWDLYMSSNIPTNFNSEIRQGSAPAANQN